MSFGNNCVYQIYFYFPDQNSNKIIQFEEII